MSTPPSARRSVIVDELKVDARVGVHQNERHGLQPLIIRMEVELEGAPMRLVETVDYAELAHAAAELGRQDHIDLIETYAEQLADLCLVRPAAVAACVEVRKPRALAAGMAAVRVAKRRAPAPTSPCE